MKVTTNINKEIFRSYDIRGKYPNEIDKNVAYTIGKAYGTLIKNNGFDKCVVGYDNRVSSIELSVSLILGILSTGMNVINLGLVTTPMCLYAKDLLNIDCYMMVTASHNPKEYNGFKFSLDSNGNARGDQIDNFKDFVLNGKFNDGIGKISHYIMKDDYLKITKNSIDLGKKKIKAVIDLANGTTTIIAKQIFNMFDIDCIFINEENDPSFPNHHPDPAVVENQKQLCEKVKETGADIGIGFDGDGDRVGVVDNKGNIVFADQVMALVSKQIINEHSDKRIVYDIKCSKLLEDEIIKLGGDPISYRTGASYLMAKVRDDNILFGGEFSGHLYFNDRVKTYGSGIYAGLRMIELLSKTDKSLYELVDGLNKYCNTPLIDIKIDEAKKDEVMKNIKDYCIRMRMNVDLTDGVKVNFKDGWCLIRKSNTTPVLTVRYEANSEERLFGIKREFNNLINYFNK